MALQDCAQVSRSGVLRKLVAGTRLCLDPQSISAKPGSLGPVLCPCFLGQGAGLHNMLWAVWACLTRQCVSHMGSRCVSHGQASHTGSVSHMGGVCLVWAVCVSHAGQCVSHGQ